MPLYVFHLFDMHSVRQRPWIPAGKSEQAASTHNPHTGFPLLQQHTDSQQLERGDIQNGFKCSGDGTPTHSQTNSSTD